MFRSVKKVHFVGIGGIGMSGIAELLLNLGFEISGSDLQNSEITDRLASLGAEIFIGHAADNLDDSDVLVYSSAVRESNPEIQAARLKGIPIIRRAEMLGELIAVKETSIAVGGTHGKTSTSSMIGTLLTVAGQDPTLVVGGLVHTLKSNTQLGSGEIIVVEADEYDRSFLMLRPTLAVVTNIEMEHTDCYENLEDYQNAFLQFCNSVPFYGAVVVCLDSPGVQEIISGIKRPVITYGFSNQADVQAEEMSFRETRTSFTVRSRGQVLGTITLQVPGIHNVSNALAAVAVGLEMGLSEDLIRKGLEAYTGVRRRFDIKGIRQGIMVVDDYAHHPTEVKATLKAARTGWDRRIVAVFQPHLFSRTRDFYREFARHFLASDVLIITDVYPAREDPIPGITGELVADAARELGHRQVYYEPDLDRIIPLLNEVTQSGDMVITLGAGTIWRTSQAYYDQLEDDTH
ncbi:MAG: UDP-N-acetylmuramate--L-alanine ligase [Candidatus Neomarinimicrobiota bacterium]|nr:MAG: UDP-N-acetylmuramate--L-alanine ligase [Candidatus Neomarinimicrobiota bacterium]